jgi:predicted deacylase
MMDHAKEMDLQNVLAADGAAERQLYVTYLASAFRTLRFGLNDAHGKGMAVQFNYLMDKGACVEQPDGTFAIDAEKIKPAVRDLDHDLLTLEAEGNYAGAKKMLDELGIVRPGVRKALNRLEGIPTDIEPQFVTADELASQNPAPAPRKRTHIR